MHIFEEIKLIGVVKVCRQPLLVASLIVFLVPQYYILG
jgi:hypothetical protein